MSGKPIAAAALSSATVSTATAEPGKVNLSLDSIPPKTSQTVFGVSSKNKCNELKEKYYVSIVEAIRKEYPAGTRVRLVKMDDIQAPPLGTEGTVVGVDDTGSLLMHWDNGSHLNIVYGSDEVEKV